MEITKTILVRDIRAASEETVSACIVEYYSDGTSKEIPLSEEELSRELEGPKWDNPWPQWLSGGIQRLKHERKDAV